MAQKKALDADVEAKRKETREYELAMRQKAGTVGNIVAKDVPVSLTEVRVSLFLYHSLNAPLLGRQPDATGVASRWPQWPGREKDRHHAPS